LEPLLTSFVGGALGEWGDKTQLFVVALAARYGRALPILLGVLIAALANALIAAWGGSFVHDMITLQAASLLVGLALVFAGVAGLIRPRLHPGEGRAPLGPFLAAAGGFFVLELGDKTQFLTFAVAARYDAFLLPAAGATAGVLLASVPAAVAGEALAKTAPLRAIRIAIGLLFLVAGSVVALQAWRLI